MLEFILLQTDAVAEAVVPTEEKLSILSLLFDKGSIWITIPLLIMSAIIIFIFVDRYLTIQKAAKDDTNFMNSIRDNIHNNRLDAAVSLCKATDTPIARMIDKGLSRLGKPLTDINEAISNVGQLEVSRLEKGVSTISTMASIAPMLGFLGTVAGMIVAFHDMATSGNNLEIADLASGIYTALITTASGLVVGILGYICFNVLVSKINNIVFLLEARATEFMDLLNEPIK
ncbi:MAG: MotA/TolQ/ExbB proton channel family protein [Bacteroidales bacterium]|nr:MotA/TolQ/ExbB proton channel family protein [Bacteroidales bacterium]MBO7346494.1 MotA/TolQ/ExbB proton channel family protein [Bacteroidales bacterium]MBQ4478606.1 MotA/TolQ/ExbB proton channel family protein [Bacteroidales bacterium]MBR4453837.1 MotA/TolQ/ExbB proton channel family protein [Bacteroidales bacterium]MCR5554963.1 MotA/TolQ/ExbB proton channel family protein [Bacteroidales bacterium]